MKIRLHLTEAGRFYRIGVPVFWGQLSQVGMNFADTVMTGHASAGDMAAVAIAGSIWAPISLFCIGCLLSLTPLTAQSVGAGDREGAAHILRQGIWLTLALSAFFMPLVALFSWNLDFFGLDPAMADLAGGYLRAVLFGLPGFLFFVNIRSLLDGFSRTMPHMIAGILGLALNLPCNYILIYGKFGLPAMGAVGCGVATSFCFWFMAILLLCYVRRADFLASLRPLFRPMLKKADFDPAMIARIFRIGLPSAFTLFFEVTLFTLSALILAPLGTVSVAAHQIASSYGTVVFMLPLALAMTATIRVGHCLGAGKIVQARIVAGTALVLGLVCALLIVAGTMAFRDLIGPLYCDEADVLALAHVLLAYTAAYQLVDCLQTAALGVLRGYNDTRITGLICFVAYWIIGLPSGYVLSRTDLVVPAMGAEGFWVGYLFALAFGAICYLLRLRYLHSLADREVLARVRS